MRSEKNASHVGNKSCFRFTLMDRGPCPLPPPPPPPPNLCKRNCKLPTQLSLSRTTLRDLLGSPRTRCPFSFQRSVKIVPTGAPLFPPLDTWHNITPGIAGTACWRSATGVRDGSAYGHAIFYLLAPAAQYRSPPGRFRRGDSAAVPGDCVEMEIKVTIHLLPTHCMCIATQSTSLRCVT